MIFQTIKETVWWYSKAEENLYLLKKGRRVLCGFRVAYRPATRHDKVVTKPTVFNFDFAKRRSLLCASIAPPDWIELHSLIDMHVDVTGGRRRHRSQWHCTSMCWLAILCIQGLQYLQVADNDGRKRAGWVECPDGRCYPRTWVPVFFGNLESIWTPA